MKSIRILQHSVLFTTLLLLLSACSSKPLITAQTIEAVSGHTVAIIAREGAESYVWSQRSGVAARLMDADTAILRFTAPAVQQQKRLVFELEASFAGHLRSAQATVIVSPATGDSDTNATAGGTGDDNTTNGGNIEGNTTTDGDSNDSTGHGTETHAVALTLTIDKTTLNKEHNTTLSVIATYDDNSTQDYSDKVQWQITPPGAVRISGHTLTALRDVHVTLRAKSGSLLSKPVTLSIYWEVNGHRLPPEPDPKINNATLLGVDVNHNGVRDDVERWIYETYKDKHPIYIDIAMQIGQASQQILTLQNDDKKQAILIHKTETNALTCEFYYSIYAKYFNEPILIHEDIGTGFLEKLYFNTNERQAVYKEYARLLSGGVYPTPEIAKTMKKYCDFNTSKYEE